MEGQVVGLGVGQWDSAETNHQLDLAEGYYRRSIVPEETLWGHWVYLNNVCSLLVR